MVEFQCGSLGMFKGCPNKPLRNAPRAYLLNFEQFGEMITRTKYTKTLKHIQKLFILDVLQGSKYTSELGNVVLTLELFGWYFWQESF